MTDLEKATYLNAHIGGHVHFFHKISGDSTAQILSVNTRQRTFNCILKNATDSLVMPFDEVIEFDFRANNNPGVVK